MKIEFKPLSELHFPLLLKWLNTTHVKTWWDQDIIHTEDSIKEKYTSYIDGYKLENGEHKSICAFVIYADRRPIGYIQLYNAYDFARKTSLVDLYQVSLSNKHMPVIPGKLPMAAHAGDLRSLSSQETWYN